MKTSLSVARVPGTAEALRQHAEQMKKFPDMEHVDPDRGPVGR